MDERELFYFSSNDVPGHVTACHWLVEWRNIRQRYRPCSRGLTLAGGY
jgi:hypothetical protein